MDEPINKAAAVLIDIKTLQRKLRLDGYIFNVRVERSYRDLHILIDIEGNDYPPIVPGEILKIIDYNSLK